MYIKKNEIGILIKNGEYKKVIKSGKFFKLPWQKIEIYEKNKRFIPFYCSSNELLFNKDIISNFVIIDTHRDKIYAHYENNKFIDFINFPEENILFWKDENISHTFVTLSDKEEITNDELKCLLKEKNNALYLEKDIPSSYKGILYIDNKFIKILEPGKYCFVNLSNSVSITLVDTRLHNIEINGQDILTKDKVEIRLNFNCEYRIVDVLKCMDNLTEIEKKVYISNQLVLREYIGTLTFDELLEKKHEIKKFVIDRLKDELEPLGIEITNAGIKDLILPGEIRNIINQVLIAEKKSQANVITRREETASTRSLLNTARLLDENKTLYRLKELEYLERISEHISNISLNGNGQLLDELKKAFIPKNE